MKTDNMENKVYETVKKYKLISPKDSVIVGLSGGADSVSLLLSLCSLKEKLGIEKIAACHINHNLRDTAKRDEEFSKKLCEKLGVDFYVKSVDIKEIKEKLKVCEEEAGRIARYEFFHQVKKDLKNAKIATAHNFNDQIETFFIRLLRGSSADGLTAIKPCREDGVIRPLIEVKREEIEAYLYAKNQDYMTDETNLETDYLRNKIRLNLLPYLKENFDFNENVIADTIELFKRDGEYISKEVSDTVKCGIAEDGRCEFMLSHLKQKDDAVLSRVIKNIVKTSFGAEISKKQTDSVIKLIRDGKTGKKYSLSGSVCVLIDYDKFIIKGQCRVEKYEYKLEWGDVRINEIAAVINLSDKCKKGICSLKLESFSNLSVRCRKAGDRVYIKGVGHKKVKDIFIDNKISREKRDNYPLIIQDDEIIWIPGLYKKEEKDGKYCLTIRRMENEN